MTYETMPSREHQGDWIASAVDSGGEMYLAFFSGPDAKELAEEYAEWKNTAQRRPERHRTAAVAAAAQAG
ncbi:MAG TPA: hypothetical protein VNA69_16280 [Thermoanaerobaculia bacterium]|nr:hypothetical protein [Thermoanaerobaculia bacterium]